MNSFLLLYQEDILHTAFTSKCSLPAFFYKIAGKQITETAANTLLLLFWVLNIFI